jgi:ABC-type Fe3+ transport system permease subunit
MRTLITIPLMVPVLIAAYALTLFFARNGLFNYLIVHVLHLASERLTISYTLLGVILACVWRYFPFVAIVVAGALESLNPSLEEAAASMGASPARAFWGVVLPLLVPSIVTGSILAFVGTFGTFSIPLIMGRGEEVLSVLAYRYHALFFDSASASTVAVVMLVVQVVLLGLFARLLRGATR